MRNALYKQIQIMQLKVMKAFTQKVKTMAQTQTNFSPANTGCLSTHIEEQIKTGNLW